MGANTNNWWTTTETEKKETSTTSSTTQKKIDISWKTFFFDVETVPLRDMSSSDENDFGNMPSEIKDIWIRRYGEKNHKSKMWLYAEFSKVICISVWAYVVDDLWMIRKKITALYGDNEKEILEKFATIVWHAEKLVWHNAIMFDAPYLEKKYIMHNMPIPKILRSSAISDQWIYTNKKPREIKIEDTMKMRKGMSWASAWLETIAVALGIKNPKNDIDWFEVGELYYASKQSHGTMDLFRSQVSEYCNGDVEATMEIYKRIISCYQ